MSSAIQTKLYRTTAAAYHADPCPEASLSSSIANVLDKEAAIHAHARHPKLGGVPSKETDTFEAGTLAHSLILGEGKEIVVVEAEDWRTKAAREEREKARGDGKVAVLGHVFKEAKSTATELLQRFAHLGIVLNGESELAALWGEDSTFGPIQCRGMLDHWHRGSSTIYDLKSCRSASLTSVQRSCEGYGYDIQRAAYVSAIEKNIPELVGRVEFVFVFFELAPPFAVTPVRMSGAFRELGQRRWKLAVEKWARCMRTNHWPAYVERITDLDPPAWAMQRDIDRQLATRNWAANGEFGGL